MHLSGLFLYPVKSLRGCSVTSASVDSLGLVGDRRFMVVDEGGRFLTQRALPQMAQIATSLSATALSLQGDHGERVSVPLHAAPGRPVMRTVSIWSSEGLQAEDCGEAAAAWLSALLGLRCRLVRIGPAFARPIRKPTAHPGDRVAFTDAFPFLAIGEASLADLNDRLAGVGEAPVPMDRFRPNLVIAGTGPYDEDTWPRVRIGRLVFRAGGPCARCAITTTDQLTGVRGKEPLRMLASYRRDPHDPTDVNFGQNFIHETKTGTLHIGDAVEPLP
jgi:uncharacterized protein